MASLASHGAQVLEVPNYSLHRGLGLCSFLRSETFQAGGCDWAIRFYPGGCTSKTNTADQAAELHKFAAVGIELLTKEAVVTTSVSLGLHDEATGALYHAIEKKMEFDTRCVDDAAQVRCLYRFMRRSELQSSTFLRDDRIVIKCALRVTKVTQAPEVVVVQPVASVVVPPSDLPEHMGRMLEEGESTDVTFEVQGKSIRAHRAVVASRSKVFKAELHGHMKERRQDRVVIRDMQPAVFRALLRFIYTDSLPAMEDLSEEDRLEITRHLLVAADWYAMDRLKLVCAQILSDSLDVESVATTLSLADRHNCRVLKDACIEFMISSNKMVDVAKTQGYASLKRTCPSVLVEVLEKAGETHKL